MGTGACEVEDCDAAVYARGLCGRHYKQVRRHGQVRPDQRPSPCAVEGCGRQAVTRGWCHGHYLRWLRTGRLDVERPLRRPPRTTCSVPGCSQPMHGRQLCRTHLRRLRVLGDPSPEVPVRTPGDEGWLTHGYRGVVVPEQLRHLTGGAGHVLEHRLVMAVLLGRPLVSGESVHHRNGDRLDNRPENLELWSSRQPAGQRAEDKLAFAYELLALYDPAAFAALTDRRPPDTDEPVTSW